MQAILKSNRFVFWLPFFIVIIGAVIRFYAIGWDNLEPDEAQTYGFLLESNPISALLNIAGDGNPPLLHCLLWPVVQIFHDWIFPEKLLAFLTASSLPLVAFLLLKRPLGHFVAIYACFLLAFSPAMIRYGELIRCYGLLHLLVLCTTVLFLSVWQNRRGAIAQYMLCVTASMYLHLAFFAVICGHVFGSLSQFFAGAGQRKIWKHWFSGLIVCGFLYVPWAIVVVGQLTHPTLQPWNTHRGVLEICSICFCSLISATVSEMSFYSSVFCAAFIMSGILISAKSLTNREDLRMWFTVTMISIISFLTLCLVGLPTRERYFSLLQPLFLVLIALSAKQFVNKQTGDSNRKLAWGLLAFLPLIFVFLPWASELKDLVSVPESQFGTLATCFKPYINPSKDLVVVGYEVACPEVSRVLPANLRIVSFPDVERLKLVQWAGVDKRIRDNNQMVKLQECMNDCLKKRGTIWFISKLANEPNASLQSIKTVSFTMAEDLRNKEIEHWLYLHGKIKQKRSLAARNSDALGLEFVSNNLP